MANPPHSIKRAWWKESSVYQIYPASFADSNNDGIGDLPGIYQKLDYIKALGVDIIWVCPIYKSPQVDMGYDISDYKDIHAPYGTVADVDRMIEGCHARGMKFVMDLVVNHTSDQHFWFQEAKKSKDNEYRDYYIWRKPKYDADGKRQPPNNWAPAWGGSAWQYDESSDEYYLHLFAPEQPDLNWENPKVVDAVHDIVRFWLEKGVDGFRMDVINFISKVPGLPDAPITRADQIYQPAAQYYACGPRLHEYLLGLGKILKEYNAFSVGEMPEVQDPKEILNAVGFDRGELNMIFHFEIHDMDIGTQGKFSPREWTMPNLKFIINKWERIMLDNDGWNALYLENHDQSRTVSRWGSDAPEFRGPSAKMFATFMGFQSGTLFIYQGQELGMINVEKERPIEDFRDLETLNAWNEMLQRHPNDSAALDLTRSQILLKSRDNARTPMQWNDSPHGGFTGPNATPWQKVNASYKTINASSQVDIQGSVFEHWRRILGLRKEYKDVLIYGDFKLIEDGHDDVFAYERLYESEKVGVVCNFRAKTVEWALPEGWNLEKGKILASTFEGRALQVKDGKLTLSPFESLAYHF